MRTRNSLKIRVTAGASAVLVHSGSFDLIKCSRSTSTRARSQMALAHPCLSSRIPLYRYGDRLWVRCSTTVILAGGEEKERNIRTRRGGGELSLYKAMTNSSQSRRRKPANQVKLLPSVTERNLKYSRTTVLVSRRREILRRRVRK